MIKYKNEKGFPMFYDCIKVQTKVYVITEFLSMDLSGKGLEYFHQKNNFK